MTPLIQVVLGLFLLLFLAGIIWRMSSRRTSLPCPSWLAWLVELENPLAGDQNAGSIVERLALEPAMNVLDAGCGPGRVTIPLARALGPHGNVVAIDMQPAMLDRARQKAREAGLTNIEFRELALGAGTLGVGLYDRVILVTVLGEIHDREEALREIHRALKVGGLLSVTEIIFDPHYQSRGTILRLAGPAGFREKAFFGNWRAFTLHLEKPTNE